MSVTFQTWLNQHPLKLWRKSHSPRISIRTLAAMLEVNPATIVNWEGGSALPQRSNMTRIEALDSSIPQAWEAWYREKPCLPATSGTLPQEV